MSNLIEMRQRRSTVIAAEQDLLNKVEAEKREFNAEEKNTWDTYEKELVSLDKDIDLTERREHVNRLQEELKVSMPKTGHTPLLSQKRSTGELQRDAFRGWLKHHCKAKPSKGAILTTEERTALDAMGVDLYSNSNYSVPSTHYTLSSFPEQRFVSEKRNQTEGSWTISGGSPLFTYMGISDLIDTAMKAYGSLLNRATIIETPNAFPLPIPTVNDVTNTASWVSEGSAPSEQDLGATASVILQSYSLETFIDYSWELLMDALFPLESYLASRLGERMARGAELAFASGSGSGQPSGLYNNATTYETAGGTTTNVSMTFDDLIGLQQSIDWAYLQQGGVELHMHQSTYAYFLKIKTTIGSYLLSEGGFSGSQAEPNVARFRGMPIVINNSMTAINTTSGKPIVGCGVTKKYHIRKVAGVEFFVNPYINSSSRLTRLMAWARFDGNLVDAGTHPFRVIINP